MRTRNPKNERTKYGYFAWMKGAKGLSTATVDEAAKAILRFEEFNRYQDFAVFRFEQAISFKSYLLAQTSIRTGLPLSKSTLHKTMLALKTFFYWLVRQRRYRSKINFDDIAYFRVSMKDARVATARRIPRFPTEDQVMRALMAMPTETEIQRRNQAVFALIFLTAARDGAAASMTLADIDLDKRFVNHDARHVRTKFSKTYVSGFFPVDDRVRLIVVDWITWLRVEKLFTDSDPVFPATAVGMGENLHLEVKGLSREKWKTTDSIRAIFKQAFSHVGLPYFHPHSIRHTIAHLGQKICRTDEERKAWSQNMGHDHIQTTSDCYGSMGIPRQLDVVRGLIAPRVTTSSNVEPDIAQQVKRALDEWHEQNPGASVRPAPST